MILGIAIALAGFSALMVVTVLREARTCDELKAKLRDAEETLKKTEAANADFAEKVRTLTVGTPGDRARAAAGIIGGVPVVPPGQTNGRVPG